MINTNPLVLTARKSLAANTHAELVAWMKATKARMAHPGTGSTGHLATFLLAQALGVEVTHIPYRGAAPALQDILGGHVDLFFATPQQVVGNFAAGEIKAFGITSREPSPLLPRRAELRAGLWTRSSRSCSGTSCWRRPARPRRSSMRSTPRCRKRSKIPRSSRPGRRPASSAYPKEQHTPAGAAAYLKKEIAHWGQVVRDNKIEAPAN